MVKSNIYIILLSFILLFASCRKKSRFYIDTKENRVEVNIQRFDRDLIRLDTVNLAESVDSLMEKYPKFLPLFIENMTNSSVSDRHTIGKILSDFVNYPIVQEVNRKVLDEFADISFIQDEIADAFTYIHHYFPNLTLPELYFYVSGLNVPMIMSPDRTVFGVGTDFYLGADFEPYKDIVYDYMLQNFAAERLTIDVVSAVLFRNFVFDGTQNRLIDNMLYRGKVLYLLSVVMAEKEMKDIVGYSSEQQLWAETHEKEIWKAIISQKDLFSTDQHLIRKYMEVAPFTAPISQESPGRLGQWMGFRIVESFMNKNKNVTLPELMQLNNYQELLEKSGY